MGIKEFRHEYTEWAIEHNRGLRIVGAVAMAVSLPIGVASEILSHDTFVITGMTTACLGVCALSLGVAGRELESDLDNRGEL